MKKFSTFKFNHKKIQRVFEQEEQEMFVPEEPQQSLSGASKFFSKLFESREMAHVYHL